MKISKYMTLYDKILIVFVIVVSLTSIIIPIIRGWYLDNNKSEKYIFIQSGNEVVEKIEVSHTYRKEPMYIEVTGPLGTSIIEAHNGKVRMKKAPEADPLKICEKTGWITKQGPRIICVPNQITVWIETGENDIDGISQ